MENVFVYCSKCGIKNFATDKKCGICGKSLVGAKSKQIENVESYQLPDTNKQIRGFIVLCLLCFGVYWNCFRSTSTHKTENNVTAETSNIKISACIMSHEFVKDKLVSPQSADFPLCSENYVNELGGDEYGVNSYVDGVNEFNAPLRQQYVCRLKYISGDPDRIENWQLVEVRFE